MKSLNLPDWVTKHADSFAYAKQDFDFYERCLKAKWSNDRKALRAEAERVMNYRLNRRS